MQCLRPVVESFLLYHIVYLYRAGHGSGDRRNFGAYFPSCSSCGSGAHGWNRVLSWTDCSDIALVSVFDGGLGRQIVLLLMKTGSALLSILLCCTIVDMYPKCYGFVFGGTTISQSIILLWLRYTMPALILYAPSL